MRNVLGVKLSLAGIATVIAVLTGPRLPIAARDTLIVLLSISMGAQLAVIRFMKVPDLLTVVLTTTVTGALTERSGGWTEPRFLRRVLAVVVFVVGAVSSTLLVLHVGVGAALSLGLGLLIAVAVAAHLVSRTEAGWSAPR